MGWRTGFASMALVVGIGAVVPAGGSPEPAPTLYLSTAEGIAVVDTSALLPRYTVSDAVPSGSWARLVATTHGAGRTTIRTRDARTGAEQAVHTLDGVLHARVVSQHGEQVALLAHARAEEGAQPGRTRTTLVVASTDGSASRTYDLSGNIEPEAFSRDRRAMFVIRYLPPRAPDRYEVRRLDLETGEIGEVRTPDGATQGEMPGVARRHVLAPDGRRLYTLYTNHGDGGDYAFVHVLDLDEQWAHCVDLPPPFGADPAAMSIAIDGAGQHVYVADVAGGRIADVDATNLSVARVGRTPIRNRHAPSQLAVGADRLYLAAERTLVALDTATFVPRFQERLESRVRGLVSAPQHALLFVAERRRLQSMNAVSGATIRSTTFDLPQLGVLGSGAAVSGGETIQCAC